MKQQHLDTTLKLPVNVTNQVDKISQNKPVDISLKSSILDFSSVEGGKDAIKICSDVMPPKKIET